jgi:hypothetical protein
VKVIEREEEKGKVIKQILDKVIIQEVYELSKNIYNRDRA